MALRWALLSALRNQNSSAVMNRIALKTFGTSCQLPAAISAGARNLVTAEPALPAPNTPMAKPWLSLSNHLAT
ncbi:hypothetical protein D9M73_259480 [compost metagenome]